MLDVFTEQIEVIIKDGIANLYWYRADLAKALIRSGVDPSLASSLLHRRNSDGSNISKRQMMDLLYEHLRTDDYNKRLEVSRNLVRILVEHQNFVPQRENHRIEVAERCALKLKEIIAQQERERETRERIKRQEREARKASYHSRLETLQSRFNQAKTLEPQQRGYELEKIFAELMRISGIPVEEPFTVRGEQFDGAIKYEGNYYFVELRWRKDPTQPSDIGSFYFKVEGKMGARGIFVSMNGYTSGVTASVPIGRDLKVLLLDGVHLANVIFGVHKFSDLLDHAIKCATLRTCIYCPHDLNE
jgi:hypothetical protein